MAETEARLQEAIQYVQENPSESIHSAARKFNVKRTTLRGRVKGAKPRKGRPGPNKLFSEPEERAICDYISRHAPPPDRAVRPDFVTDIANVILAARRTSLDSPPLTVGTNWTARFLKRHGYSTTAHKPPAAPTPEASPQPDPPIPVTEQQLNTLSTTLDQALRTSEILDAALSKRLAKLLKSALLNTGELLQVPNPAAAQQQQQLRTEKKMERRRDKELREAQRVLDAHAVLLRRVARKGFAFAAKEARRRRIAGVLGPCEVVDSRSGVKFLRRC